MLNTPLRRLATTLLTLSAVLLLMVAAQHRSPGSLLPHGYCFTWNPTLLWAHVASDSLIGTAYVSIPLTLIYLVRKRTDLPFNWIVVLFATFIVSCGTTHWIEVWTVWNPDYWLSAIVKMITATASILTAAALIYLVPRILAIPTVEALNLAKAELEAEVSRRVRIEDELRAKGAELELRVRERTAELSKATEAAHAAHSAAHEANLQKDRFLAKVSHELRTPLQSTLTWVTVLKTPGLAASRVALATERIAHNVAAQARLIDDLLDISRILSGKLLLEWRTVDPVTVTAQAVSVVQDARPEARIDVDFASAVPTIRTDPARLEQVAWNLINNAVQASVAQHRVLVTLRVTNDELRLDVQDWGAGIPLDELSSIFEPFLQRSGSVNQHRGLGLGLAIVRSIVRLLGGDIRASSPGPGAGALFSVSLPLLQADETTGNEPERPAETEPTQLLKGLRLVYIEDEEEIARGVEVLLADAGVHVSVSTTFDEAITMIRSGSFDLLLTDLTLDAGHSGHALLPVLRETHPTTPAIVLSAFGREADRLKSIELGFVAHLVKPVSFPSLAQAILQATRKLRGEASR